MFRIVLFIGNFCFLCDDKKPDRAGMAGELAAMPHDGNATGAFKGAT